MKTAKITMNGVDLQVPSFVPELTGQLAIVHLSVLQRLAALLPNASFKTIKERIAHEVSMTESLDQLIMLLENELAFQTSVNQIRFYNPNQVEPANIDELR
jgi:hypothetical protein